MASPFPNGESAGSSDALLKAAPAQLASKEILVDPAVSRAKFDRELEAVKLIASDCRRRGWWVLDAEFPNVLIAFAAPQLRPRAVVFGALLNFDNYDLWAPSVRIVDPFTSKPLLAREMPPTLTFARRVPGPAPVEIPGVGFMSAHTDQPLLLNHGADQLPFFCIPGVREYHEHPAHSGDDWLLHRARGEGTLYFLVEKLGRYGVEAIQQYQFGLQIVGYLRGETPE